MDRLKLPVKLLAALDDFTARLKDIYGDGLVSIVLYGSASSGEFSDKYSNVNIIVVLKSTGLANLSKAISLVNSRKFRMISPLFFTEEYINGSLDVFPIEFLDISENHAMLFGKDVFKGLRVDDRNLRFQCEHELKSKLINIKKLYLTTRDRKALEDILFKTVTSTLHIMRNIIRLKGIRPPYLKDEILRECEKVFGMDVTILREILWAKSKKMALSAIEVDALLSGLVKELETIVSVTDKL